MTDQITPEQLLNLTPELAREIASGDTETIIWALLQLSALARQNADPRCPGSPFQSGGLASRTLNWVENGALHNLCYTRYWASKHGKDPTGWPANLILDGGNSTLEEMIASTGRGLLVTRFWYIRVVDPMRCLLTGMTRDGLFRIENGRLAGPVKHLRFNESVPEALSRVEALSSPERADDWILAPAIKVRDFTFTSGTRF